MNFSFFIARRIIFNTQPSFSRFIIRLAMAATALSVAAMVITLSMVNGFQKAVSQKVYSFWGHMRVQPLEPLRSMVSEEGSFSRNPAVESMLEQNPSITHFNTYAVKSIVLKTKDNFEGVLLKGVSENFSSQDFSGFLKKGRTLNFSDSAYSNDILLSEFTARQLAVTTNDTIQCFFIRGADDIRSRPLIVCGIYKTGIEDYDNSFVLADIRFLRRLNLWDSTEIGGYEAWLRNPADAGLVAQRVNKFLPQGLNSKSIQATYPNIFDWLSIQDQTKKIVLVVMMLVAAINLITCLLILVMERTRMVGVLKAVGMAETHIQRIFWYYASWIALTGIGMGLLFGLGICWIQQLTGFIKMDEATYYVSEMPVHIIWWQVVAVAAGSFLICFLALRLPLMFVKTISPVKAIRFK